MRHRRRRENGLAKAEPILYLSGRDLEELGMFHLKAKGGIVLPPKIFSHRRPRFYSSMVSSAPSLGYAGCK